MKQSFQQLVDIARGHHDLFAISGVRRRRNGTGWGVCPLPMHAHANYSPSFSIYWNRDESCQMFKCHGNCGAYGDVIDFVGYKEIAGYNGGDKHKRFSALEILEAGSIRVSIPQKPKAMPTLPDWLWEKFLPRVPKVTEYLLSRGLLSKQLAEYRIGSATRAVGIEVSKTESDSLISIPIFHHGKLMGIKIRNMNEGAKYRYFSVTGSRKGLWNHDAVFLTDEPVLVMKGEIAAMVASRFFLACAPSSGEWGDVENIIQPLIAARKIVVGDNDEDGKIAAHKRAAILGAIVRFPTSEYKDWDEWYLKRPDEAIAVTKQWLEEA